MTKKVNEEIKSLENKISFWESKLKTSCSASESAILDEKIKNAKMEIIRLNNPAKDKTVIVKADNPVVADKIPLSSNSIIRVEL